MFVLPGLANINDETWKLIVLVGLGFVAVYVFRHAFHWFFYKWRFGERVVVVGSSTEARQLAQMVIDTPLSGFEMLGMRQPGCHHQAPRTDRRQRRPGFLFEIDDLAGAQGSEGGAGRGRLKVLEQARGSRRSLRCHVDAIRQRHPSAGASEMVGKAAPKGACTDDDDVVSHDRWPITFRVRAAQTPKSRRPPGPPATSSPVPGPSTSSSASCTGAAPAIDTRKGHDDYDKLVADVRTYCLAEYERIWGRPWDDTWPEQLRHIQKMRDVASRAHDCVVALRRNTRTSPMFPFAPASPCATTLPSSEAEISALGVGEGVGTVALVDPQVVGTVPSSAVFSDETGATCIFPSVDGAPVAVTPTGGTLGTVDLDQSLVGQAVLINPRDVRQDLTCG